MDLVSNLSSNLSNDIDQSLEDYTAIALVPVMALAPDIEPLTAEPVITPVVVLAYDAAPDIAPLTAALGSTFSLETAQLSSLDVPGDTLLLTDGAIVGIDHEFLPSSPSPGNTSQIAPPPGFSPGDSEGYGDATQIDNSLGGFDWCGTVFPEPSYGMPSVEIPIGPTEFLGYGNTTEIYDSLIGTKGREIIQVIGEPGLIDCYCF